MNKIHQNRTCRVGRAVTLMAGLLFLTAATSTSYADSAFSPVAAAGQAAVHATRILHGIQFYDNLINKGNMLVLVPEPGSTTLAGLGALIGLAAWRLRRRRAATAGNRE